MKDWNKMNTGEYIKHLEQKFRFDSSGTAKAVFELISTYKELTTQRVNQQRELLVDFCAKMEEKAKEYKHLVPSENFIDEYLKEQHK